MIKSAGQWRRHSLPEHISNNGPCANFLKSEDSTKFWYNFVSKWWTESYENIFSIQQTCSNIIFGARATEFCHRYVGKIVLGLAQSKLKKYGVKSPVLCVWLFININNQPLRHWICHKICSSFSIWGLK